MGATPNSTDRFARQRQLSEIGDQGQAALTAGSVLVIGAGGLGSASAYYLAAAGIGTLGLVDPDVVELSNLNRQILHHAPDLGRKKVDSAAEKIRAFFPEIRLQTYAAYADAAFLESVLAAYDFVVDGTDSFTAKYAISDTCVRLGKAFSHAGVSGFKGQTFTFVPGPDAACYRCLFPEAPPESVLPDKAAGGILGAVAGTLGTWQALEAVKYLTGTGQCLVNRLCVYDGKSMQVRFVPFAKRSGCRACS